MARSLPQLVSSIFLLFLLLLATGMGPRMVAEARMCESASQRFRGICVRSSNCASVCQSEGFADGHCRGFRRRCLCRKQC
ncbi:defensin-like protein [Neltuma alba]|uniref:defensin-like protein n=1 Tax=Neltuma alba TaxID=207710 RepID=UPI0010A4E4FC|nr:defensin-like protein [Prosopis alba]XP_028791271.1 defensin-like protein [Prosopis alba]